MRIKANITVNKITRGETKEQLVISFHKELKTAIEKYISHDFSIDNIDINMTEDYEKCFDLTQRVFKNGDPVEEQYTLNSLLFILKKNTVVVKSLNGKEVVKTCKTPRELFVFLEAL